MQKFLGNSFYSISHNTPLNRQQCCATLLLIIYVCYVFVNMLFFASNMHIL